MRRFILSLVLCLSVSLTAAEPVRHVTAAEAAKVVETKAAVVLDIRTPAEFRTGHLAGAQNIDFRAGDFAEKLGQLDKAQPYLIHCASGGRSTSSLETFAKLGFKQVFHLDGGIRAWVDAGLPVEK